MATFFLTGIQCFDMPSLPIMLQLAPSSIYWMLYKQSIPHNIAFHQRTHIFSKWSKEMNWLIDTHVNHLFFHVLHHPEADWFMDKCASLKTHEGTVTVATESSSCEVQVLFYEMHGSIWSMYDRASLIVIFHTSGNQWEKVGMVPLSYYST